MLWNLISLPTALIVPDEIAEGDSEAAVALLFPLIGVGLAAWAIRAWLQLKRFKVATFVLPRLPVPLGGRLKGTIRVDVEIPVTEDFRLELECIAIETRSTGKGRSTEEKLLWQKQWRVPRHQCQIGEFATIPVDTAMPTRQPPTTMEEGDDKFWSRLEVADAARPRVWSDFELPVFDTGEAPEPAAETAPAAALPATPAPALNERPTNRELAALGIDYAGRRKVRKHGRFGAARTRSSRPRSLCSPRSGESPEWCCSSPTRRS